MMKLTDLAAAGLISLALGSAAFAAGSGTAPSPTSTTEDCKDGQIWDKEAKKCVKAESAMFDDDTLYRNAREFAYAGQYDNAINLLKLAQNQDDPRIMTYYGFAHRKAGRVALGMQYYADVLAKHPDYTLARAYYGQALILQGDREGAKAQLVKIAALEGTQTYAYTELANALNSGYVSY